MSKSRIGLIRSEESKILSRNSCAVNIYEIRCPNGDIVKTKSASFFCKENNLNHSNLVVYGKTKGFSLLNKISLE